MESSVSSDFSMGVGGERQAAPAESWLNLELVPPDITPVSLANCKGETCFCGRKEGRRGRH